MCLIDNRIFRFTLRKIPVYKVVEWYSGCYHSPIKGTKVERIFIPENRKNPTIFFNSSTRPYYKFGEGFIHAYDNLTGAQIAVFILSRPDIPISILEGYIPPFTRYAIDKENHYICARKMIFPDI